MRVRDVLFAASAVAMFGLASAAKADYVFPDPGAPIHTYADVFQQIPLSDAGSTWTLYEDPREEEGNGVNPLPAITLLGNGTAPHGVQQFVQAGYLILDEPAGDPDGPWSDVVVFAWAGKIDGYWFDGISDRAAHYATTAQLFSSVTPTLGGFDYLDAGAIKHFTFDTNPLHEMSYLHIPEATSGQFTIYAVSGSETFNTYKIDSVSIPLPASATMGLSLFAGVLAWAGVRRWRMA